jgi:hypothetical protein
MIHLFILYYAWIKVTCNFYFKFNFWHTRQRVNLCQLHRVSKISRKLYQKNKILHRVYKPKCIYVVCVNHRQRNKIKFQDCEKLTRYTFLLSVCMTMTFSHLIVFQTFRGLSSGGIQSTRLPSWSKIHSSSVLQW